MSLPTDKVYDQYASIVNYKEAVVDLKRPALSIEWIPDIHLRRLKAYEILCSYYENYSRDMRQGPEVGSSGVNEKIIEVGDPAWVADKIKNKLLGDSISISIPVPKKFGNEKNLQKLIDAGGDNIAEYTKKLEELKLIQAVISEMESYLQDFWRDNFIYLKVDENEAKCSYLGDCVYFVGWNPVELKPEVDTFDPGFCFPFYNINAMSLQEGIQDIVKDRFIVAWEEALEDDDENFKIYRDVFELRRKGTQGELSCWRQHAYYKYSGEGSIDDLDEKTIYAGTDSGWVELEIDFLPFVWVPNTQIQGEDFGRSNLHNLLQVFDVLMTNYTDLDENGAKLGGAIIGASGKNIRFEKNSDGSFKVIGIKPNTIYPLGEDGRLDLIDTSKMQTALIETKKAFEGVMIRNSNITEIVAGKIEAKSIPSGVALRILMQPLLDMINPMRKQRQQHYGKLFFFIQRWFQIKGDAYEKKVFGGDLYNVYLDFGKIVPEERKTRFEEYSIMENVFDKQTVLEIAKEDGYEIDVETILSRKKIEQEEDSKRERELLQFEPTGE